MNSRGMKIMFAGSVFIGVLGLVIITKGEQAGSSPSAGNAAKTAEQAYKNIQVLKGTPADQIIPSMQFISSSLGVDCEFCHTAGALDKDDKKSKEVARKMIQMQFAINKDSFKGEPAVTCFSCHRGAHNPVATPIIADEEPKHPEAPKATEANTPPTADQIIEKYIQAVGGADALQKISSRSEKGSVNAGGHQSPIELLAKAPDKRISIMHTPNGDSVTAYDGHMGWLGNPGRPAREMNATEADGARMDADFNLPGDLKKIFNQFRVRSADKIGDREVVQLIGAREGQPPVRLYFDQQSGLLLRMVRYAETPLGRNPTQIDYADYRPEDGVKIPHRWTLARPSGRFAIQVDQVQQNIPIDDSKFAKPGAPTP